MRVVRDTRAAKALLCAALLWFAACSKKEEVPPPDRPRLTPKVAMRDVTFHSTSLNREMPYRVVIPASIPVREKLQAVYLLHGGGGGFHDWTNYSDVAKYAEHNLILIMPEGNSRRTRRVATRESCLCCDTRGAQISI